MSWDLYRVEEYSPNELAFFYYDNANHPGICLTGIRSNSKAIYSRLRLFGIFNGYIDTNMKYMSASYGRSGCYTFYTYPPTQHPQFSLYPATTTKNVIGPATTPRKGSPQNCGWGACFNRLLKHPDPAKRIKFQSLVRKVFWSPARGVAHAQNTIIEMVLVEIHRCKAGRP
jgi:hypothetical protein